MSVFVIAMVWSRLVFSKPGPSRMVPTLWIVLSPIGQSITAMHLLAVNAHFAAGPSVIAPLQTIALIYGVCGLGFGLVWLTIAATITLQTAREDLPFSLTWWSFTFPVGTMVTGATGVAAATGSQAIGWLAIALFVFLVCAWATVAVRTISGTRTRSIFA